MKFKSGVLKDRLILSLTGELDDNGAEKIRREMDRCIERSGCDVVVFDLTAVSFMDSTGIGLLLGRYKRFRDRGVRFYVQNPNLRCDKIFTLSGVYHVIPKIAC